MSHPNNPTEELKKAIDRGAMIVAGTGVSIGASWDAATGKPHPQASWTGLLQDGLRWLKDHKLINDARANAHLAFLGDGVETHHCISAAQDITKGMGGEGSAHYADWLSRSIGTIKAHDRKVLSALESLRLHGNLLATTNYDSLLLEDSDLLRPITWKDSDEFLKTARNKETNHVIFLHGHWRKPETVILDWNSYDQISRDQGYRADLEAVWKMTTWVYVGCGMNGIGDPDLGLLLERYGKRARQSDLWDFCLVLREQRDEFQAFFDRHHYNICAISYGDSHTALPGYLVSLLPVVPPITAPPSIPQPPLTGKFIPQPPAFYAEPDYIGSHKFVGRQAQLDELNDWARAADPTNMLLYEAIGGNGKSMLTWEWTTNHAMQVRGDWAGRFWYSFYERGAIMADFCQHALAYMTGQPFEELRKKKTVELIGPLLAELHKRPWLMILDGLERVLVAYHRIDAASVPDEEANAPTDKIVNRDPCNAIRDEDNDLLRRLAAASPSKILVSSRLTPRILLNSSGQPIPGVKRITLPGLRPQDAEALLRSCDVQGDSEEIQRYLSANCDNHPLVIGILGGIIRNYLPGRGNFDAWAKDADGGAKLDLSSLDLVQRRNHILRAAFADLSDKSRQLLSTLALLSEAVDYDTLMALNPHLPEMPEEVYEPDPIECGSEWWEYSSKEEQEEIEVEYQEDKLAWEKYHEDRKRILASKEYHQAPKALSETVLDLERRSLLQYDHGSKRYGLHPVVRGVAAGDLLDADKQRYGQKVLDHFTSLQVSPYEQAQTLEDLSVGLHIVRTYIQLGQWEEAVLLYQGDLSRALLYNLEAYSEILALIRPFFPSGWNTIPQYIDEHDASYLINDAGVVLGYLGESETALICYGVGINLDLNREEWGNLRIGISNFSDALVFQETPSRLRLLRLANDLAQTNEYLDGIFRSEIDLALLYGRFGQWDHMRVIWKGISLMELPQNRAILRPGDFDWYFAMLQFWQGTLQEEHLVAAEKLARKGANRRAIRDLHRLRGEWHVEQEWWSEAIFSFAEAIRMARELGLEDETAESGIVLAKIHLGELPNPEEVAMELLRSNRYHIRYMSMIWFELGDTDRAKKFALRAYEWAWGAGEPYVDRYELTKATELLNQLGVPLPELPPYDPANDKKFPWEDAVVAAIEKLKAEKEAKKKARRNQE